jgi:hypothetical protein
LGINFVSKNSRHIAATSSDGFHQYSDDFAIFWRQNFCEIPATQKTGLAATTNTSLRLRAGWPDWASFCILIDSLLWAVFRK